MVCSWCWIIRAKIFLQYVFEGIWDHWFFSLVVARIFFWPCAAEVSDIVLIDFECAEFLEIEYDGLICIAPLSQPADCFRIKRSLLVDFVFVALCVTEIGIFHGLTFDCDQIGGAGSARVFEILFLDDWISSRLTYYWFLLRIGSKSGERYVLVGVESLALSFHFSHTTTLDLLRCLKVVGDGQGIEHILVRALKIENGLLWQWRAGHPKGNLVKTILYLLYRGDVCEREHKLAKRSLNFREHVILNFWVWWLLEEVILGSAFLVIWKLKGFLQKYLIFSFLILPAQKGKSFELFSRHISLNETVCREVHKCGLQYPY